MCADDDQGDTKPNWDGEDLGDMEYDELSMDEGDDGEWGQEDYAEEEDAPIHMVGRLDWMGQS
jgi:hypothetical protein